MPLRRFVVAFALVASAVPAVAAPPEPVVRGRREVVITGTVTKPDPAGCGSYTSVGCDEHGFAVDAKAGTWVTVRVPDFRPASRLRVRSLDGLVVSESGESPTRRDSRRQLWPGGVTFRQPRTGVVRYVVGVSTTSPQVVTHPWSYRVGIRLAGSGWDREEDCIQLEPDVAPTVPADLMKRLPLAVTIVTTRALLAEVRTESAVLVAAFRELNIALRLRFVVMELPSEGNADRTFAAVRARFGGERPAGSDVVYVANDDFAGGVADCLGGVRFPERAFALGQVHYTAQGVEVPGNRVRMGHIAAHEIGHLLGAHHEHSNCAEAQPEAAVAGDGPCTVMSPAALTVSGQWSTVEAAYIRHYVARYARG